MGIYLQKVEEEEGTKREKPGHLKNYCNNS